MQYGKKDLSKIIKAEKDVLLDTIIDDCVEYAGDSYEDFGRRVCDILKRYKLVDYGKSEAQEYYEDAEFSYIADEISLKKFIELCEAFEFNRKLLYHFNDITLKFFYNGEDINKAIKEDRANDKDKEFLDCLNSGIFDDFINKYKGVTYEEYAGEITELSELNEVSL